MNQNMSDKILNDEGYWLHKTKLFLHDPPDKAIHIPGHEERSNDLIAALGMVGDVLHNDEYRDADSIASGMDRACLPGYVPKDETRNGAVDFLRFPQITHPTGANTPLQLILPQELLNNKSISQQIQELLREDSDLLSEDQRYKGNAALFSFIRFHYLFFILRRRLAQKDIGGLGGLWYRLPADTRLPDHSIWQHCGMVSAIGSCKQLSPEKKASLMVYAITPVQDFIIRARKLRDYWSGSILLSWLAFEGIKAIICNLGADHVVYPSLHGQPLVDDLLKIWGIKEEWLSRHKNHGIASFPNKFVCLVPTGKEKDYAEKIRTSISNAWRELGEKTLELLSKRIERIAHDDIRKALKSQFDRQTNNYWEHHWSSAPLVTGDKKADIEALLHKDSIASAFDFWQDSQKIWPAQSNGEGQLYSVTHRLVQAGLAAGKAFRPDLRPPEEGIKCDLFGEFEILHYPDQADLNPRPSKDPFWQDIREAFGESEFGKTERLCALGLIKRLAYRVCKDMKDHPLHNMFKNAEQFPSTTEMALHDWWHQINQRAQSQDDKDAQKIAQALSAFKMDMDDREALKEVAQWFHVINEREEVNRQGCDIIDLKDKKKEADAKELFGLHSVKDIHKYYAVLMMDGDRMGKLINGETLGSKWETVLHSNLVNKFNGDFDRNFKNFWATRLNERRLISPAVHAAISEALGDFSIVTVPSIIEKYDGRLIYAGGDDVCAVLPASTVLLAAREIADAYGWGFVAIKDDQAVSLQTQWRPEPGQKLAMHLGKGDGISISAGILIAHHKKPLGRVLKRCHELLEKAKKEGGRNAFALEVDKRAGGGRIFMAGWQEESEDKLLLDSFLYVSNALQASQGAAMSSSLAYRLSTFEEGLQALIAEHSGGLAKFIAKQLERSGVNKDNKDKKDDEEVMELAQHIAALINRKTPDGKLPLESIIVAEFIGRCRAEHKDREV
ncbi:MAG: type III-B CRISPR-associated protein Cas10/Cmr2 [Deltaproteobacteria bacterium]|nr:type III-B CRISPR-associated protein Cas10/Cmr2 [Deltaproteobacteria bacterium]